MVSSPFLKKGWSFSWKREWEVETSWLCIHLNNFFDKAGLFILPLMSHICL